MTGHKVYVVQNLELGYDNVIAVFSSENTNIEDVLNEYIDDKYYIEEHITQELGVH